MKLSPFWVEDHARPEGLSSDLASVVDVLIIGSGLTGLSAALRLADGGRTTMVIDAGDIASGASSRNGGMVSPDIKGGVEAIWKKHGEAIAREAWNSTVRSVELVKHLASDPQVNADVTEGGMTGLALNATKVEVFEREVRWYREKFGVEWEVLGPDRVGDYVGGSDKFVGGFYEPEGIGIQPAQFAFGMARAASAAGAALVPRCSAVGITSQGSGYRVETSLGPVKAGEVFVATNGYTTAQPINGLARKIVPVGSYIIVTEPLSPEEAAVFFPTNSMAYTSKRLLNYMRRTPDDRILIGGRRNLHTDLDLDESAADLRRQLIHYWPSLAKKEITHAWGGKLGVTFDLNPHMGQFEGVWYAMGYGGHGVGLSTQLGYEFAGMLLGKDPPSVFSRIPNRGRWYYRGRPWFLSPASALYRTLDVLGR